MSLLKVTRAQEEIQTLKKFIENQGIEFISELAIQDKLLLREPCDVSYQGVEYQITYGNRKMLGDIRKANHVRNKENLNVGGPFCKIGGSTNYVQEISEALKDKKNKSDKNMTLLIEVYPSPNLWFIKGSSLFLDLEEHFKKNERELGGLWQHIFVVFYDCNIQLR